MSNLATIVNNILADSGIDDINVVVTNGSYSNPAWITALSWSKITSTPTTLSGYGITDAVPANRTITINGTAQDLSVNRSWSVGTVTSVDMTVPTGFSISGRPITSSGTLALTFSAGYSLPTTAVQSNWTTAYNDSIVSAAVSGTTTKTLTLTQQDGGTITASWTDYDTAPVTSVNAGTGISVNQTTGAVTVTNTGVLVNDITSSSGQGRFGGWYQGNGYTGAALEVGLSGGNGYVITYDRSTSTYLPLIFNGSNIYLNPVGGGVYINTSPLIRQAAGVGWLSGNYASSETASTTGAIYSIGGSYYPTSTTLNTMYGVGYTHSAQGSMPSGASGWGFYVNANGTVRVWLGADNGNIIAIGDIYANTSSIVATRTWVNSQGFITGGPYLPLSGGTLTGPVALNNAAYFRGAPSYGFRFNNDADTLNNMTLTNSSGNLFVRGQVYVGGNGFDSGTQVVYNSGTWGISITGNADTVDGYHATNAASGLAYYASNGYLYAPAWINVDNGGIFSSTNSAHFRPNPGSYGPWLVTGSRNGWSGIEFESLSNGNVNLMVSTSSNVSGFHNNSYGWQMKWEGGSLYVFKNTYGGGTQATVLDSSNYNSYAPTLTGTGASGTWGINITGSSGTAGSTQTLALTSLGNGSVNVNNPNTAVYRTENGSGAALSYSPVLHVGGGDTMWQVQGTYGTSGNGTFYFRQGYNGSWGNWLTMLSSANYSSYALPLTGGTLSGTLTIGGAVGSYIWNDGSGTYIEAYGNSTATRKIRIQSANSAATAYAQWFADGGNLQIYGAVSDNVNFLINSSTVYLRYNGADKFWTGSDGTRNNGWLYFQTNGNGIHYPNMNSHFYMPGGNYWHINPTENSTYGALILYSNYNGTAGGATYRKGYLYYDTNGFGLLGGGDGNWAININTTTSKYVTIGGDQSANAYNTNTGVRLMFGGGNSDAQQNYYIGTNLNNYGGNYNKLDLAWHTGIRIGAQTGYGGIRMYADEDFSSLIFSVGEGDSNVRVANNLYMGGNIVATQYWVNSQGFATGGPFVPVSGGINMTGSFGLNDNRLYLRTNGDNNHYIWNADDDWEELVYYTGTGFRIKGSAGSVPAYITNSAVYAGAYRGKDNVAGTGEASYHPAGIYSTGTNWLYGTMYLNVNPIYDTGDIRTYNSGFYFRARYTAGSDVYHGSLNWYGLQLGNNGDNYIIGGRSATGGALVFYTNNTSDFTTVNGTFVAKMHSTGRTTFGSATDYGYALSVAGSFFATDWIRVNGTSGLYFESYGGGWRMTDSSYIRAYNGKALSMEGASVDYVSSIYMNGGVYIQTFNNRNLIVKSTGSSDAGILGRGSGDQFAFQVYGSGGDYGFLNSAWGAWDIRKTANGSLYMNDNTSYYLNTTSSSVSANINGAILSNSSFGTNGWGTGGNAAAGRVYGPKGASYSYSGGGITGAVKIRLPFRNSDGMWSMKVRIYNYSTNQTSEYILGNYSYSNGGWNSSATFIGGSSAVPQVVRFGNEGGYDCVWIGETSTGWSYPVVSVMDFMMGYSNGNVVNYYQNWDITIVGAFGTVQTTISPDARFNGAFAYYYYDANNASYYTAPAGTSFINNLRLNGKIRYASSVADDSGFGLYFDDGMSDAYAIYREPGSWSSPYPDLRIAFHTGISLGANANYGGIRFFTDYTMASVVLYVNNASYGGGGNVYATGSITASSFFEISDARTKTILDENHRVNDIHLIKPKLYKKDGRTELGYIAQEFIEKMPYALTQDGEEQYYSLIYREVHTAKIAYLEDSIEEIKAKILYLENQLKTKQ